MRIRLFAMVSFVMSFLTPQVAFAQTGGAPSAEEYRKAVLAFSDRIDQLIAAKWKEAGIQPAPRAEPGKLFRRLSLDLTGKIPSLLDIGDFVDPTWMNDEMFPFTTAARLVGSLATPQGLGILSASGFLSARANHDFVEKRWIFVEKMLSEDTYGRHFANFWRSQILAGNSNVQAQGLQFQFENWLRTHLQNNTPYNKMVFDLLTVAPFVGGNMNAGSPSAFYFANENKPENLAGATTRMFLGVKLECAQCHAHPFAKWTRNQFWEFAAFFSGIQQNNRGGFAPVNVLSKEIAIPGTGKTVKAKFLNGADPVWKNGVDSRTILAEWVTAPDNPFFAKAAVDHVWSYFFGVSLLEPIYEPNEDHPVVHEELVEEMARQFTAQKFDLKFLIRAIVNTQAYQRTSMMAKGQEAAKDDIFFFARMPVRGLSPEQIYDSVDEATRDEYKVVPPVTNFQQVGFGGPMTPRVEFLAKFTTQDKKHETQTSILQALFLMNGKYLADRIQYPANKALVTLATQTKGGTAQKVKTLFMMVLSRPPRPDEAERFIRYIDSGGPTKNHGQALADVYWVLLNSGEFLLNH